MRQLTQTSANCWQTCVAMLLDEPPEKLPDQTSTTDPDKYEWAMRAYLHDHHDLAYVEASEDELRRMPDTAHLIIGESSRSQETWHSVVGVGGEVWWDPHPSRAGLVKAAKRLVLVPFPDGWRGEWQRMVDARDARVACACRACQSESRCAA